MGDSAKNKTPCPCWLSKCTQITFPTSSLAFLIISSNMDLASPEHHLCLRAGVTHVMSDNLRWPLKYPVLQSDFFPSSTLYILQRSYHLDSSSHRTGRGTGPSACICGMEQNETGKPSAECFFSGKHSKPQQPQTPPEECGFLFICLFIHLFCRTVLMLCC